MHPSALDMNEQGRNGLQELVRQLCSNAKIPMYHTWNSKFSAAGFPDCIIFVERPALAMIVVELKKEKRRPSRPQAMWLDLFARLSDRAPDLIEVYLWRPTHWLDGTISDRLVAGRLDLDGPVRASGRWEAGRGPGGDRFGTPSKRGTVLI